MRRFRSNREGALTWRVGEHRMRSEGWDGNGNVSLFSLVPKVKTMEALQTSLFWIPYCYCVVFIYLLTFYSGELFFRLYFFGWYFQIFLVCFWQAENKEGTASWLYFFSVKFCYLHKIHSVHCSISDVLLRWFRNYLCSQLTGWVTLTRGSSSSLSPGTNIVLVTY